MDGRPGRAGDDGHPPHEARQRPLAPRVEEPFAGELFPQLPQGQFQGPDALGLDLVDDQLIAAARGVDVEVSLADHFQAVAQIEAHARGRIAPECRADLRPVVLERQIAVARLRPREIGDFAATQTAGKAFSKQVLDLCGQFIDRQDRRRVGRFRRRVLSETWRSRGFVGKK